MTDTVISTPLYSTTTGALVTNARLASDGGSLFYTDPDTGLERLISCPVLAVMTLTPQPAYCNAEAARELSEARLELLASDGLDGLNQWVGMEFPIRCIRDWTPETGEAVRAGDVTLARISEPYGSGWDGFTLLDWTPVESPWEAVQHFTVA